MALVRRPGRKVWVYQCKINGRTWTRSTGEKEKGRAEAKVPELRRFAELHRERPNGFLRLKKAIVREVERIQHDVSESEADRMSYALENFFKYAGDVQLEKITPDMLEKYQRQRLQQVSVSTVNRELYGIIRLLRVNGFSVAKPSAKRGRSTRHRPFTDDELKRFFSHCTYDQRVLFMLMLCTGARPAELIPSSRSVHVALLKEEVDTEHCTVTIRTSKLKVGQEEKVRRVRIPQLIMSELVGYALTVAGLHVFPPNQSLCKLFDRILHRAGIDKFDALGRKLTAHSFRHTYATIMAEAVGNNPFVLKEALGHSQISTTDRYCHATAPEVVIDVTSFLGVQDGCTQEAPATAEAS